MKKNRPEMRALRTIESLGPSSDLPLDDLSGFSRKGSLQVEQLRAFNLFLAQNERSLENSQFGSKLSLNLRLSSSANSFKLTPAPSLGATPNKRTHPVLFAKQRHSLAARTNNAKVFRGARPSWTGEGARKKFDGLSDECTSQSSKISSIDPYLIYQDFGTLSRLSALGLSEKETRPKKKEGEFGSSGVKMLYFPEKFDARHIGKTRTVTVQREGGDTGLGYTLKGVLSPQKTNRNFLQMVDLVDGKTPSPQPEEETFSELRESLRKYTLSDLSLKGKNIHEIFATIAPRRYDKQAKPSLSLSPEPHSNPIPLKSQDITPAAENLAEDARNIELLYSKFKPEEEVAPLCQEFTQLQQRYAHFDPSLMERLDSQENVLSMLHRYRQVFKYNSYSILRGIGASSLHHAPAKATHAPRIQFSGAPRNKGVDSETPSPTKYSPDFLALNQKFERQSQFLRPQCLQKDEGRHAQDAIRQWGLTRVFGQQNATETQIEEDQPLQFKTQPLKIKQLLSNNQATTMPHSPREKNIHSQASEASLPRRTLSQEDIRAQADQVLDFEEPKLPKIYLSKQSCPHLPGEPRDLQWTPNGTHIPPPAGALSPINADQDLFRLNRESSLLTKKLFAFQHQPQIKALKNRKMELLSSGGAPSTACPSRVMSSKKASKLTTATGGRRATSQASSKLGRKVQKGLQRIYEIGPS